MTTLGDQVRLRFSDRAPTLGAPLFEAMEPPRALPVPPVRVVDRIETLRREVQAVAALLAQVAAQVETIQGLLARPPWWRRAWVWCQQRWKEIRW